MTLKDKLIIYLYHKGNEIERETYKEVLLKILNTPSDGVEYIRELAIKFFKQQNIIKTANEILRIAGDGNTEKYEQCVIIKSIIIIFNY